MYNEDEDQEDSWELDEDQVAAHNEEKSAEQEDEHSHEDDTGEARIDAGDSIITDVSSHNYDDAMGDVFDEDQGSSEKEMVPEVWQRTLDHIQELHMKSQMVCTLVRWQSQAMALKRIETRRSDAARTIQRNVRAMLQTIRGDGANLVSHGALGDLIKQESMMEPNMKKKLQYQKYRLAAMRVQCFYRGYLGRQAMYREAEEEHKKGRVKSMKEQIFKCRVKSLYMSIVNRHDDRILREAFLHRWWVGLVLAQRDSKIVVAEEALKVQQAVKEAEAVGYIQRFAQARLLHEQIKRNLNVIRAVKSHYTETVYMCVCAERISQFSQMIFGIV